MCIELQLNRYLNPVVIHRGPRSEGEDRKKCRLSGLGAAGRAVVFGCQQWEDDASEKGVGGVVGD